METVEVIVYMGIAVIIGGLILAFIGGFHANDVYDSFKHLFNKEPTDQYEKITSDQLPRIVLDTWELCGLGTAPVNKTVYVSDSAPVNRSYIFTEVKAASLCRTLQSASNGCGTREDINDFSLQAPIVLQLQCDGTITIQ